MPDTVKIITILKELYPDAVCSLEYAGDPWRLLVAARLSAQCTDERVNLVCVPLFRQYPDVFSMAEAEVCEVETIVKPCGLYHTKAESIVKMSRILAHDYGGKVPDSMEELLKLPGVGRKIANLVLGDVYGKPGIVADTHCIRINGRLGYYPTELKDPEKVEKILSGIIPPSEQSAYCHRMVMFGREYCSAKKPRCPECPLAGLCEMNKQAQKLNNIN